MVNFNGVFAEATGTLARLYNALLAEWHAMNTVSMNETSTLNEASQGKITHSMFITYAAVLTYICLICLGLFFAFAALIRSCSQKKTERYDGTGFAGTMRT